MMNFAHQTPKTRDSQPYRNGASALSNESLDEKIVKKKSIPAQIVLWVVIIGLLYLFYKAFAGHFTH